jgi:hypothetical protein
MSAPAEGPRRIDVAAAALVVVSAVALALIRVQAVNLPWHLATARLAQETGHWPAENTFSYTFPHHPIFQQYPAFQRVAWDAYRLAGFAGLSVLNAAGWTLVLLLFVRWAGPWRRGVALHALWMLGLCALQRRMIFRPDLFSMLALGAELLLLDAYLRGGTREGGPPRSARWAVAGVPLVHWLWVLSHQLFPVSLLVQGLFVAHVFALRRWQRLRDEGEAPPPLGPPLLALGASVALCFATPLGAAILHGPARTAQSLTLLRAHVAEFARVWTMPLELGLALLTGVPAAWALWRSRRAPSPFDLGLWLLSLALLLSAVRGLMFFGVVSVAVFQRALARARARGVAVVPPLGALARTTLSLVGVALTALLAGDVVYHRWIAPPLALGGTQPGAGAAIGGWGEAATAFLARTPPPGRMLNMSAGVGDLVIWAAPAVPVFVDSRMETYPIPFLRQTIDAESDDATLDALVERWDARWMFAEHTRARFRDRLVHLVAKGWVPVYVDSELMVIVRPTPETAGYIAAHRLDLERAAPGDLVAAPAALRAQQRACFARLLAAFGETAGAEAQRRAARAESGAAADSAFEAPP